MLETTKPESVGISSARLTRIREALSREVDAGNLPGAVVAIVRRGKIAHVGAIGHQDPAARAAMTPDAIFSIASMTKPMTSVAAMMLHEEGRLLLGDPVEKYLPALAGMQVADLSRPDQLLLRAPARAPTIQDLLRHTSGLTYRERGASAAHKLHPPPTFEAAATLTKEQFLAHLAKAPLLFDPGSNWEYGSSTDVLGLVVEAVTGKPLETVLSERIWQPLGMTDTSFTLPEAKRPRYALALAKDPLGGAQQSVFHAKPHTLKWGPGGAAAVSTAADYLRFCEAIRQGGVLGSARLLGPKTVAYMASDHLPASFGNRIADAMDPAAAGYGFGLGFAVRRQDGIAALMGSAADFYWSGVFGTYFWIDPKEQLSAVFMAAAPGLIRMRYRQLVRALVYQAIDQ
jgi:CubicO group peptidase (beta-lactamase class C family)